MASHKRLGEYSPARVLANEWNGKLFRHIVTFIDNDTASNVSIFLFSNWSASPGSVGMRDVVLKHVANFDNETDAWSANRRHSNDRKLCSNNYYSKTTKTWIVMDFLKDSLSDGGASSRGNIENDSSRPIQVAKSMQIVINGTRTSLRPKEYVSFAPYFVDRCLLGVKLDKRKP